MAKSGVTQTFGQSKTSVPSQKLFTDAITARATIEQLDTKFDKSGVTQAVGASVNLVPSQKLFTDAIAARVLLAQVIGLGQSWSNVTALRQSGVTYTNGGSGAIAVSANSYNEPAAGTSSIVGTVGGVVVAQQHSYGATTFANIFFIVPPGATYKIDSSKLASVAEMK